MKLALCLQVWNGDVFLALRLLRLICSIEPEKRNDVEFIIAARRGTNEITVSEMVAVAKEKFASVHLIKGKRFAENWPAGCNSLWQEAMMRIAQMRENGAIRATGVLTFESDCLPLRSDWIARLDDAWDGRFGKHVIGHAHACDGVNVTHINGNAIFDADIIDRYPKLQGSDDRMGWDCYHGELLLRIGRDTPYIFQRYRLLSGYDQNLSRKIDRQYILDIEKAGETPAIFHGIKGDYGMKIIEEMVKDGSFFTREIK